MTNDPSFILRSIAVFWGLCAALLTALLVWVAIDARVNERLISLFFHEITRHSALSKL